MKLYAYWSDSKEAEKKMSVHFENEYFRGDQNPEVLNSENYKFWIEAEGCLQITEGSRQ